MLLGILRAPYWLLPMAWLHPRKSLRLLEADLGRTKGLLAALACLIGLSHGLELANWVSQANAQFVTILAAGPVIGCAYVYGLAGVIQRRYRGRDTAIEAIQAALILMYAPAFWAACFRKTAMVIGAGLSTFEMDASQSAAYQWLGLISLILYFVAFWMSYVCLSEATGIPMDKLDEPATNRELIFAFLGIIGLFLAAYLAKLIGLVN